MKLYKREVLQDVWSQFLALALIVALSVDSFNPIKAVCSFLHIPSYYCGFLSLAMILGLVWNNMADILYRCTRVYLNSILTISFKSVDIVGLENIPTEGPIIFTGNHSNQFVDGMVVMMTSPRKVGFLIAEKSWYRPVIGDFARIMGCIPVVRPQDSVIPGVGKVKVEQAAMAALQPDLKEYKLIGQETNFTAQMTPGDQLRFQGSSVKESGEPVKILKVINDTTLIVENPLLNDKQQPVIDFSPFGIFKKVDQGVTFAKVYSHLNRGHCIGIFPEGGSHDRTDLLPLKAGVAIMALGVRDKYNVKVPVIPVGLSYFRGHRFRGRVTVEFGTPIYPSDTLMETYKTDKRNACNTFLHLVEEGMRSVIVTGPNYNIMQLIFAARRLFQRSGLRLSVPETQDLNRRFAEGYKILSTIPEASKDLQDLQVELEEYTKKLKLMGIKDHQVPFIAWWSIHDVIGTALYGTLIFVLASIPTFVLNAPVGLLARQVAAIEQKKALAGSTVKVTGRDVLLSKKIGFSMVAVPILWFIYFILLSVITDWYWSSIVLVLLSFPLFSFFGVRSVEVGMLELKTIRPLFYRLLPQYRKAQDELPITRRTLQKKIRTFVNKYSIYLGSLVEPTPMDWHAFMHQRALQGKNEIKPVIIPEESETTRISATHDLSFLKRSKNSMINLAGLDRSMTTPPGFQQVLEQEIERRNRRSTISH